MRTHTRMHRRFEWLAVASLMTMSAACAHAGMNSDREPVRPGAPITLTIRNDNWYDMRVYELRSNGSVGPRVATVTGLTTERVRLRAHQASEGYVRLLLRPIGSSETYVAEPLLVRPGTHVDLRVMNNLRLSYLHPVVN